MRMHHHKQSGYTLLEMTVIIGIVATLLGSYLAFYKPTQDARATAETKVKIEKILDSVASHALRFGYLPCPAPVNNFTGIESRQDGSPAMWPNRRCVNNGFLHENSDVWRGIVPFSTLGLTQDDAKDGFGRYMSYLVVGSAAESRTVHADNLGSEFCNNNTGNLRIFRNDAEITDGRAYVLVISYGPEGIGGYNMSAANVGNRLQPIGTVGSLGARERRNAVDQNANRINIELYSTQTGNNHFDDVIGYMTRRGVISRLGTTYCGRAP
jgi:hypothetical protein